MSRAAIAIQDIRSKAEALGYRVKQKVTARATDGYELPQLEDPGRPWYVMALGGRTPLTYGKEFWFGPFATHEEASTEGLSEILRCHARAEQLEEEHYQVRVVTTSDGDDDWFLYRDGECVSERFVSPSAVLDVGERLAQEAREKYEQYVVVAQAKRIERCRIPTVFTGIALDNFTAKTTALTNALQTSREYVRTFMPKDPYSQGLWFCGDACSGKTSLACAVASALAIAGHYARYAPITEIVNAESDDSLLNELRTPDLLVADWFGITTGKDKRSRDQSELLCALSGHAVRTVLEARHADNRPTLLIADCDLSQLKRGLGRENSYRVKIVNF